MSNRTELARYHANLQAERDGAALYRTFADLEKQPTLEDVFLSLVGASGPSEE